MNVREILQSRLPYDVSGADRLPGVQALDPAQWLIRDEAFAGQMAYRDALISTRRDDVLALRPEAEAAARELLSLVLAEAYPDVATNQVRRADGRVVTIDDTDPMATLGRIVQEDFCILQKQQDEHALTGAILCFPANWRLAEKIGRGLVGIHDPVDPYDDNIARRVQRLFDGVQVGRPLWRCNALRYDDPDLFQPNRVAPRHGRYLRSERQTLRRLPDTRAVVFGIHTFVLDVEDKASA